MAFYLARCFWYLLAMHYFPVFLDLRDKRCLLVGAGAVGMRKLYAVLDCEPAEMLVLDPCDPGPELQELIRDQVVRFGRRQFRPDDLEGRFLVVAATNDQVVNRRIAALCRDKGVLCNVADDPDMGNFFVPSHFRRGPLTVAVSTSGLSPAMAKSIRADLQELVGERYSSLLEIMGRLRPLVLAQNWETARNTELFRAVLDSPLPAALRNKDLELARAALMKTLPETLHANIGDLLNGLA